MFTFKAKITLFNILFIFWLSLLHNFSLHLYLIFVFIVFALVSFYYGLGLMFLIVCYLTFLLALIIFGVLFRYFLLRFYYGAKEIDYFFDKDEFGVSTANSKMVFPRSDIKDIKINSDALRIRNSKLVLHFLLDKESYPEVKKYLENSNYKELI